MASGMRTAVRTDKEGAKSYVIVSGEKGSRVKGTAAYETREGAEIALRNLREDRRKAKAKKVAGAAIKGAATPAKSKKRGGYKAPAPKFKAPRATGATRAPKLKPPKLG